jgi:hypothetical protein
MIARRPRGRAPGFAVSDVKARQSITPILEPRLLPHLACRLTISFHPAEISTVMKPVGKITFLPACCTFQQQHQPLFMPKNLCPEECCLLTEGRRILRAAAPQRRVAFAKQGKLFYPRSETRNCPFWYTLCHHRTVL